MSTALQARTDVIKKLNVMVRRIEGITSFILVGSKQCPLSDIHVVIGTSDKSSINRIYADINFLICEFLSPKKFNYIEKENRIIKNYELDGDITAEITVCSEDNFPKADWWVSYWDKNSAALTFYGSESKRDSDPIGNEYNNFENEFSDDFDDDFDDDFQEETTSVDEQPSNEHSETFVQGKMIEENPDDFIIIEEADEDETLSKTSQDSDQMWEYIYGRISLAKRAIAGGSMIYAGEIINELRTQLIKLICEQSGITEDYMHSIDLLSNDYQKAIFKTYPSKLENSTMISALAAELSLFEQLIK